MPLSVIVAIDQKNAIGKDNRLLWHLPADLQHFKRITSGHTIIMGRKTYDSIGKALPNRRNIVISRNKDLIIEGVEVVGSLEDGLGLCGEEKEVFIIGGAEIYRQALPYASKLYLTCVEVEADADTFFPAIDPEEWQILSEEKHAADEKNKYNYTFKVLEKSR